MDLKHIHHLAEALTEDLVAFLRDLIAIPSVCGNEEAVIHRIRQEMEKIGFDDIRTDGLGNLVGLLGNGEHRIAIDGHCDTVDTGNRNNWAHDPFEGKHENGIIYGRGACDQKGGLASAIYAGKLLKQIGIPQNLSLMIVASILEEDQEGFSWNYMLKHNNLQPEVVLLTEPSNLGIRIGQRGRAEIRIVTHGHSCHSSAPDRGENAVYKIAPIISEIEALSRTFPIHPLLGQATLAVTDVRSTAPSLCAVPELATLCVDRRLTETDTPDSILAEIAALQSVRAANADVFIPHYPVTSYTGWTGSVHAYYPTWLMAPGHPCIQTAIQTYRNQFGNEPTIDVWQFSTNGVCTNGQYHIPTFGFGPGEEKYAHTPDDQVNAADLIKAAQFYAAFAWKYSESVNC
ncbi:MAG: YgeY family selenium metabolism-linked hydrolase [Candidatus Omnitrophota bacterium]